MTEKIHYDNNIFFLTALISTLNDAVNLKVDAEYFAEKVLEDALFIGTSIQKLYGSLKDHPHLMRREKYLHSIMKLKKNYGGLLENLLSTTGAFAAPFETMRPKIRRITAGHLNDAREIRKDLEEVHSEKNDLDMISLNELNFLMHPIEDPGDH